MYFLRNFFLNLLLAFFVLFFIGCTKGHHHHSKNKLIASSKDNKIHVKEAWIRAVPTVSKNSAAYMIIMNHGTDRDKLITVKSSLSKSAEIHNVEKKDGMIKMVPVPFVNIPGRGKLELKPGSYHIMLIKLNKTPKIGEVYELILNFEKAKKVKINASVKDGAPMKNGMSHDHG